MRLILCFILLSFSLSSRPLDVKVTAKSAIVMNADTGAILYEKHPHIPSYPASVTKIATALFMLEQKRPNLDQLVTVPAEALKLKTVGQERECPAYWGEVDGTKMGLLRGEIVSFESLLHGLMMISGNDAANTLAASLSGSIPIFMDELNGYLRSLGCVDTQLRNPHGLHHPEHVTTAYDLCLITKQALQLPQFREVVSKVSYLRPKTNKRGAEEIRHTNPLLKPGKHHYPKSIGVKTGYHSHAMYTLVAAAEHEGRTLIVVLLGCPERADRYNDAIRLFEAAFAEAKTIRRLFGSEELYSREIPGAKGPLRASLGAPLEISFYPAEEPSCKAALHWDPVHLPVRRGQKVGEVRVQTEGGIVLQKGDLFAQGPVEGTFFFVLKEKCNAIFR